jgi:hypothetical protein
VLVHRHARRDCLAKGPNGGITKVTGRTVLSLTIGIRQEGSMRAHRAQPFERVLPDYLATVRTALPSERPLRDNPCFQSKRFEGSR